MPYLVAIFPPFGEMATLCDRSNNMSAEDSAMELKLTEAFNDDDIHNSMLLCRAYMQRVAHLEDCLRQVSQEAMIQTRAAANAEELALEAKDIAEKQAQDLEEKLKKQREELSIVEKQHKKLLCELAELHRHSEWQAQRIKELQDSGAAARIAKLHSGELEKMRGEHKSEKKQLKQELKQARAMLEEQRQEVSVLLMRESCCIGDVFGQTTEPENSIAAILNETSTQTEDDNSEGWKHLSIVLQSKIDRQDFELQAMKEETVHLKTQLETSTTLEQDLQEKLLSSQQHSNILLEELITMQQREEEAYLPLATRKQTNKHTCTQTDAIKTDPPTTNVTKSSQTDTSNNSPSSTCTTTTITSAMAPSPPPHFMTSQQLKLELELSKLAVDLIQSSLCPNTISSSSLPGTPTTTYCTPFPGSPF